MEDLYQEAILVHFDQMMQNHLMMLRMLEKQDEVMGSKIVFMNNVMMETQIFLLMVVS